MKGCIYIISVDVLLMFIRGLYLYTMIITSNTEGFYAKRFVKFYRILDYHDVR